MRIDEMLAIVRFHQSSHHIGEVGRKVMYWLKCMWAVRHRGRGTLGTSSVPTEDILESIGEVRGCIEVTVGGRKGGKT
ncbi:hypothetical protein BJV77DRAFT_1031628 [Russula vinacea]|nr:hypothetical protein BJV77DRAFT_1031628 [Russula vinacea]